MKIDDKIKIDVAAGKDNVTMILGASSPEEMRAELLKQAGETEHACVKAQLRLTAEIAPAILVEFERYMEEEMAAGRGRSEAAQHFITGTMIGAINSGILTLLTTTFQPRVYMPIGMEIIEAFCGNLRDGLVEAVEQMQPGEGETEH